MKRPSKGVREVPFGGLERQDGTETIFEKDNYWQLPQTNETYKPCIHEPLLIWSGTNTKESTLRHIVVKLRKPKGKHTNLKRRHANKTSTIKGEIIRPTQFFFKQTRREEHEMVSSKCWEQTTAHPELYSQWKYPSKMKVKKNICRQETDGIPHQQNFLKGNSKECHSSQREMITDGNLDSQEGRKYKRKGKYVGSSNIDCSIQ